MADEGKATTGVAALSVRESEILTKAWMCLKSGPPEIDYEKLAGECGMTNPRSANNAWGAIRKKMGWAGAAAAHSPSATKSNAGKRKKTAAAAAITADNEDDNDVEEKKACIKDEGIDIGPSPTKKPRKKGPARKTVKVDPVAAAEAEIEKLNQAKAKNEE